MDVTKGASAPFLIVHFKGPCRNSIAVTKRVTIGISLLSRCCTHVPMELPSSADLLTLALKVFTNDELASLLKRQFEDFVLILADRLHEDPKPPLVEELEVIKMLATSTPLPH
jgi:hypothetical protein